MNKINEQKISLNIYRSVEIYLNKKIGRTNTDYVLDTLGRGQSFLDTICLIAYWFNDCFSTPKYKKFNLNNLKELGSANLKAWIGYTLYDYLRDNKIPDNKKVLTVSIANICNRDSLIVFNKYADKDIYMNNISNLYDSIDLYYIEHLKPNFYANITPDKLSALLYKKSIAASLTALLTIPKGKDFLNNHKHAISFFKHYFNARQLSDDLDDFKKDLLSKIITPVTLLINKKFSESAVHTIIRKEIDTNITKAKKHLSLITFFDSDKFIKKYVKPC